MNPSFKSDFSNALLQDEISMLLRVGTNYTRWTIRIIVAVVALFALVGTIREALYGTECPWAAWLLLIGLALFAVNKVYHGVRPSYDQAAVEVEVLAAVPEDYRFWFKRWHHNWEVQFDPQNPVETEQEMPYLYWEKYVDWTWKTDLFGGMNPYVASLAYMKRDPKGFEQFVTHFHKNNDIKGVF